MTVMPPKVAKASSHVAETAFTITIDGPIYVVVILLISSGLWPRMTARELVSEKWGTVFALMKKEGGN